MGNKQSGSGTDVKLVIEDSEIDYEFSPEDTVGDLKSLINENFEIPVKKQEVMLAEDVLEEGKTLAEYEIQPGDTIYIYDIRKDKTRKRGERKARVPKPAPKKDNKIKSKGGRFKKEEPEEEPEEQADVEEEEPQEEEEEVEEEKPKKKSAVNKEPPKKETPKKEEPKKEPPKKGQRGKKEEPKKEEPKKEEKEEKKGKKEEKKEEEDEMKYKGLVVLGPEDAEFSIDFNDDTKVQEIADLIVTEFDIPMKFQEIYFKETKLANKQLLVKVGLKSNDELKVKDIRYVDVTLKVGKEELNGHFQKTTKIQKIMEYVEKQYNIPYDSQDVYYNEKYAESSATLQKLKVTDGTSINIFDLREDEDGDQQEEEKDQEEGEEKEEPEPEPEPEPEVKKDTKKKPEAKKPVPQKEEPKKEEPKKTAQSKPAAATTTSSAAKPPAKAAAKPAPPPQKIDEDDDEEESEEEKPQPKPAPPPAAKVVTPAIPPVQPKVTPPKPAAAPAPAPAQPKPAATKKADESDDDEGDEDEGPFIDLKVDFDGNIIEVDFGLDERIFALKEFLSDDTSVPMESIEITYDGKVYPDQTLIEHLNVQPNTIIYAKDTRK